MGLAILCLGIIGVAFCLGILGVVFLLFGITCAFKSSLNKNYNARVAIACGTFLILIALVIFGLVQKFF